MWKIPLFDLSYDEREQEAVIEVLQSKWLSAGPKTEEFEDNFSKYLGGGVHCCAVSSCTAALHISLLLAGVGQGDEVILPALTFVADLNVVEILKAKPVLADIKSAEDWNISPDHVARLLTPRTKALILVHFAGYPCDMDELMDICHRKNIALIEDVAHAVGGAYKDQKCGTFGEFGCFSFFSNKNLSVGEGGMIVSKDKGLIDKARLYRSHGMTSMTIDRHRGDTVSYDVVQPGFNYRLDEIRAALGIVQLKKLDANNQRRKQIVQQYLAGFEGLEEVAVPWKEVSEEKTSSYHIFPVLLPRQTDRASFVGFLKERGIQTSIHYPAFSKFSYYGHRFDGVAPKADEVSARVVTLPLYPSMTEADVGFVVDSVQEFFAKEENELS